ncbi:MULTISPECIES: hypothetical protein [Rheinheimera]|jgi:hypothetical protein|uniref:Uncharacterized protein n=1 Tax=Rheinheimera aquimaris TaxID=412437 RepID=A0ABP3NIC3_9GAMM|nr:hypothetical protein [Rheinheimera aquimaris]MCB5212933.1 hypothetical protein [Rheinheimera aquimaris]|tara:strand:- start:102 stop:413 length:312 start_codon:yes stop_codon:yes gene_type:complete
MGITAIIFALDVLLTAGCIYLASRLAWVKAGLNVLLPIVFLVSLISLIPTYGWLLGIVAYIYLLVRATSADFKDAVCIVIFTKLLSALVLLFLSQAGVLTITV